MYFPIFCIELFFQRRSKQYKNGHDHIVLLKYAVTRGAKVHMPTFSETKTI